MVRLGVGIGTGRAEGQKVREMMTIEQTILGEAQRILRDNGWVQGDDGPPSVFSAIVEARDNIFEWWHLYGRVDADDFEGHEPEEVLDALSRAMIRSVGRCNVLLRGRHGWDEFRGLMHFEDLSSTTLDDVLGLLGEASDSFEGGTV